EIRTRCARLPIARPKTRSAAWIHLSNHLFTSLNARRPQLNAELSSRRKTKRRLGRHFAQPRAFAVDFAHLDLKLADPLSFGSIRENNLTCKARGASLSGRRRPRSVFSV